MVVEVALWVARELPYFPACCRDGTAVMYRLLKRLHGVAEASGPAIRSSHP